MNTKLILISAFILSCFVMACNKKEMKEGHHHKNIPEVNITSPEDGAVFHTGDTVLIKADMSAEENLHGYSIKMTNEESDEIVFLVEKHVHHTELTADTFWVNTFTEHVHMNLKVTAIGDHDGTTTTDSLTFHCEPH